MFNVLIVNYNTQKLTECAIRSVRKTSGDCHVFVFDNSDKQPFCTDNISNITVIDNTRGQIIDFGKILAENSQKDCDETQYGSMKHCLSVDKCFDIIGEPFILLDSDVLLMRDVKELIDNTQAFVGDLQYYDTNDGYKVRRLRPECCFINTPILHGIRFYNERKMWYMTTKKPDKYYDTGAYFLEQVKKRGLPFKRIRFQNYVTHLHRGSTGEQDADKWLEENKELWT